MTLTDGEIIRITKNYIGVEGGYLGDFSYASHRDFYPEYCDLDIDPEVYSGTTRLRFIEVLKNNDAAIQAQILRGVLEKYPVSSSAIRTSERADWVESLIRRLESGDSISLKIDPSTPKIVKKAITDALLLMGKNGFESAVDRMHTALHAYLISACDRENLILEEQSSLPRMFRLIWTKHPAFKTEDEYGEKVIQIFKSFSGAINALNELRNSRSLSHPNELLPHAEAELYVNSISTLFSYLDAKIEQWRKLKK